MAKWTFEQLLVGVLAIIAFVIVVMVLTGFKFGSEFWYTACGEVPEGPRCFKIGGEAISCASAEDAAKYAGKTLAGYYSSVCNIYNEDELKCNLAFPNLTRNEQDFQFCKFIPASNVVDAPAGKQAKVDSLCLLNAEIACEDLSQKTSPRCQDIKGCVPINAIRAAFERLRPPA